MNLNLSFVDSQFFENYIVQGLIFSLKLTLLSSIGGITLGVILVLMRLSKIKWLYYTSVYYVNIMRSVPLVMVILWFFLLAPIIIGQSIGAELSAVITFTAFESAYFSEIIRSGINSIPIGQFHASEALGMSYIQSMRLIILPQAFTKMLPVILTQVIILFQDTSLVYVIGIYDLLKGFETAGKNYGRITETYLMAAIIYFFMCYSMSLIIRFLYGKYNKIDY